LTSFKSLFKAVYQHNPFSFSLEILLYQAQFQHLEQDILQLLALVVDLVVIPMVEEDHMEVSA
jgi:hypothetical protein